MTATGVCARLSRLPVILFAALWFLSALLFPVIAAIANPAAVQDAVPTPVPAAPNVGTPAPVTPSPGTPAAVPAAAVLIPTRPENPRSAKVYTVLETHCARCHQTGKIENKPLAAGGIANILDVGEIANDPRLVQPGSPDASLLYEVLRNRHSPANIYGDNGAEPGPDELETIREWIRELPGVPRGCPSRLPIKAAATEALIEEALRVERDSAKDLRFISLVNLYNACVGSEELAAYRQAVTKLMNSLSWAQAPQKLRPLDQEGTLLAFRLADFGWVSGHWDVIERRYPKAYAVPLSDKTKSAAGAANLVVRADWLADAIGNMQFYYQLTGMPPKLADLAKMNAIDIEYNLRIARARRAVVRESAITRGNRLAERHPGARGGFWLIYDFATSSGDQDLFEHPLGPKSSPLVKAPFKHDIVRALFALPNGFNAFALFDAAGARIDRVLPGVERPLYEGYEGADRSARSIGNCFGCHDNGLWPVRDAFRSRSNGGAGTANKDIQDAAFQLSGIDSEMQLLQEGDNEKYRNAMRAAGIDPDLKIKGEEIITALARRYSSPVDLSRAAIELELGRETFEAALAKAAGPAGSFARRIQHGWLPRQDAESLLSYLKGAEQAANSIGEKPASAQSTTASAISLNLWIDKVRPASGDLIAINAEADKDCFLTLINVDGAGKATVLFPNDFEPDNLLSAGKTHRVPGASAPYQLRIKDEGRETLVAQCSTSPAPPTGIEHDFSRQRFTVLGNWENFVRDSLITEADLRRNPNKAERARSARAQALRRLRESGARTEERQDTSPGRPVRDGRAVVVLGSG
jgi:Domain of unknown function (DUF4384)